MRKFIFSVIVASMAVLSGCDIASTEFYKYLATATSTDRPSASSKTQEGASPGESLRNPDEVVIILIQGGVFVPPEIRISSGTQVRWVNEDETEHRIASNPCPMHSELPALTSLPLKKGDAHNFTFTARGTVGYHDHFNPEITGEIIIE